MVYPSTFNAAIPVGATVIVWRWADSDDSARISVDLPVPALPVRNR